MRGAPQRGLARLIFRIRLRTSGATHGRPSRWRRLFQFQYKRNPLRCQAMTVSGLTRSSAERQSFPNRESPTHRTRSANGDAAYAYGSHAARPAADAGEQESLLAEQRELGNDLAERRVRSAWSGKATGRDSVNATISMRMDFLVGTGGGHGAPQHRFGRRYTSREGSQKVGHEAWGLVDRRGSSCLMAASEHGSCTLFVLSPVPSRR